MCLKKILIPFILLIFVLFPIKVFAEQYHLLIITPDEFSDELGTLVNWKEATGRPTILKN